MDIIITKMLGATSLTATMEFILRILIASSLGAIVGIERSKRQKEAGIRTHSVVACAAAAFMILSKYGFSDLELGMLGVALDGIRGADPSRIASQVVTGLGFLGAGVIFKTGNSIKGLTTAAGLWTTAAIGMAVGAGMYLIGLVTALVLVIIQVATHKHSGDEPVVYTNRVTIVAKKMLDLEWIWKQLGPEMKLAEGKVTQNEDSTVSYYFTLKSKVDYEIKKQLKPLYGKEDIVSVAVMKSQTR